MSANKTTDTKVVEDSELDSGFISGPIDQWAGEDSGVISSEISSEVKSDEKQVPSDYVKSEYDSGVLEVYDDFSSMSLDPKTVVPAPPVETLSPTNQPIKTLPPLYVLFKQDDDGDTQLHIAAIHGCVKAISTLLKVCPNKELLDIPNDQGHTALHLAVMGGNAVVTRMLVIAGASIDERDHTGETPLHKATSLKNVECIKALLNPVQERPQRKYSTVLNQKNYNGQACVHLAAASGHVPTLQALLYYGADVNCKENLGGWSALHVAASRGHAPAVEWLCRAPGVAAGARDHAGRTPRRLARRHARLLKTFAALYSDSESDSDDDEYDYDSDNESLFEKLRDSLNPPLVA